MRQRRWKASVAASAVLVLAATGCQTGPIATSAQPSREVSLGKADIGQATVIKAPAAEGLDALVTAQPGEIRGRLVAKSGRPIANARVVWGDQEVLTGPDGSFVFPRPSTSGVLMAFPQGHAPIIQAVQGGTATLTAVPSDDRPMAIAAAAGGQYVSSDGTLKAQIPPGALSADAAITVMRMDTSGIPVTDWYIPGIQFTLDLGGATLNPDAQITVSAQIDDRFVDAMKARDAAFTPEKYNLTQDASGAWFMSMPVKGPSSASAPIAEGPVTVAPFGLQEFGGLPLPPQPEGFKVAFIPGTYDYDDEQVRLTNGQVIRAPKTTREWSEMESRGVFGCGVFPHCYYYGKLMTRYRLSFERKRVIEEIWVRKRRIIELQETPEPQASPLTDSKAEPIRGTWKDDMGRVIKVTPKAFFEFDATYPDGTVLNCRGVGVGAYADKWGNYIEMDFEGQKYIAEVSDDFNTISFQHGKPGYLWKREVVKSARQEEIETLEREIREREETIIRLDREADDAGSNCDITIPRVNLPTHTTWISDDPALNGQHAQGVKVSFSMLVGQFSGPNGILSDGQGVATTNALEGTDIVVTPSFDLGPVSGSAVQIRAAANMAPVELRVVKNSPKVVVNFTAPADIPSTVDVAYAIDGGAAINKASLPVTFTDGRRAGKTEFYAIVPDDAPHSIKLTSVFAQGFDSSLPAAASGQRNGTVSLDVKLFEAAAK